MKIFKAIDLSYRDYTASVKRFLSKTFSDFNTKYNNSTIFGQLITVIESTVQNIMLYIEDAFVEQNKFTATRKKSIYGLAQMTGYNPSLGKTSGVQVKLSWIPTNSQNLNVIIDNHCGIVCNQNGLEYKLVLPQDAIVMSVAKDNSSKYLYAVQGEFETQRFVSEGGNLYLQHVNFVGDIDEDYITVKVNNEKWERAQSLYDMEPDGKQWFYKTSIISGIILGFGNDVYGRALKDGDEIEVTYLKHDGERGNINNAEDVRFRFTKPIRDISGEEIDGNNIFNISLATTDSITSGTFSENMDQVKQMIGYTSRAMVLASPENYKAFIDRFSFCGYNRTWSEVGSLVVNSLIMRNYQSQLKDGLDYFALKESDFYLTQAQKDSICRSITRSGRQLAGVSYNVFDPKIMKYAMYLYIKPKGNSYDRDYLSNKIRKLIGEFFSNLASDIYVPKSDIIQLLKDSCEEIDGVNVYFLSEANETAIKHKQYIEEKSTFDPSTGTYKKTQRTIYLYDGEDPGLGLDEHGNIFLENDEQYPVLMGGWSYISSKDTEDMTMITDPLIINYE
jgi:hypothetical protein